MCKTYRQRVFCPGDTHKSKIVRTVRAVDVDTSGNSILREAEDNNNNSCKCGIVDMLFLPPVIDYSLEKSCAGCIEEERILVGRVMSLKKAIEEDGEEDGDGDGELVPIGMRVEGRNNPGSSTEANGDGTTSSTFALTGARCIPVGGGGGVSEPSCLPSEIGKPVAPATGPGYISVPVFLPIDDDVDERRRRERVGGEAFTSSEKFVNYPQALVNDRNVIPPRTTSTRLDHPDIKMWESFYVSSVFRPFGRDTHGP